MSRKTEAIIRLAVAMGYGQTADYTAKDVVGVLKQIAVKMQCATAVCDIRTNRVDDILNLMAANYGDEEVEPYDLTETKTHANVTYKLNGRTVSAGKDQLHNGDKLKVTASGATGYDVTTLTANGTAITSGSTLTIDGHNIAIVATGTLKTYDLERTATGCTVSVTKGGAAVSDGEDVLTHGDVLTITAAASEGYGTPEIEVNGETFTSGETLTVSGNVTIVATAEETDET